jgi:single-stranded-DNA-specific exonuclease
MFPKTKWVYPDEVTLPDSLLELADGNPLVGTIYQHYGVQSAEDLLNLRKSLSETTSPFELPDIEIGIDRILQAIKQDELIAVWGDFDADGQTSTSILVGTLRELGAKVIYHIPVRGPETHGINLPYLQTLFDEGIRVLLTCDTGIREFEAALACKTVGVDMIITDHHTPAEEKPDAFAVISGQLLPDDHSLHDLCGAGCAYKFSEALFIKLDQEQKKDMFLDLAAIGTIADLVLLNIENRRIVRKGLDAIRCNPRPAIAELLKIAQIEPHMLQEEHIGFQIAPRMNALGRLGDANDIVPFFLSTDMAEIRITASRLDGLNMQRKQLCDNVFRAADDLIQREPELLHSQVLILHHPNWPGGINGLVASQLTERYQKPSIVLTAPPEQNARGSARSIEGINITEAIASQETLLSGFGGHSMAAGLSLPQENLELFRKGISDYVSQVTAGIDITAKTYITLKTAFANLSLDSFEKIEIFSPYGPENPSPVFLTENVQINNIIALSKEKQHLKLACEDAHGNECVIFWWNGDESQLQKDLQIDVLFHARPTSFRGKVSIQCTLLDFQIHEESVQAIKDRKIRVIDRRKYPLTEDWIDTFLQNENHIIWAEGKHPFGEKAHSRETLLQAEQLLLGTTPSSYQLLEKIIHEVNPQVVILAKPANKTIPLEQLLTTCIGLLKFAIKNKNGQIPQSVLEIQTGQRPETIKTVLLLLDAQGLFKITNTEQNTILAEMPGQEKPALISALKKNLIMYLNETKSFHKYFQTISVEIISEMLN